MSIFFSSHQAGWFPFNLENELQLPGENQEEMEAELHNNDLHGMVFGLIVKEWHQ